MSDQAGSEPKGSAHRNLPEQPVCVIAHRGASASAPEHTRFAYDAAVAAGADAIEIDVRLSRDGVPVCLHDRSLWRVAGRDVPVSALTLAELKELDVGSWFNRAHPRRTRPAYVGARVVTLAEQLERWRVAERPVELHLELKDASERSGRLEEAVVRTLREHDDDDLGAELLVVSFDATALRRVRRLAPGLAVGLVWEAFHRLPAGGIPGWVDVSLANLFGLALAPDHVAEAHRQGMRVHVWTVEAEAEVAAMLALGVDGMVTDRPGLVRRVVDAHGRAARGAATGLALGPTGSGG